MADNNSRDKPRVTALEDRDTAGERLFSPSAARNRDPIRAAFLANMPKTGKILEIGSGTGEHAVHLASALPEAAWFASDADASARTSIAAWIAETGLRNLKGPFAVDVTKPHWTVEDEAPFDGLVSINMIHIAPFAAAEGLFAGAKRLLRPGGRLFLYGPFMRDGVHTAPSNEAFDVSLKTRDPTWGVRDLDKEIEPLANRNGLVLETVVEMPANNLSIVFSKT
jgi:SAM-dependent methyltransferase